MSLEAVQCDVRLKASKGKSEMSSSENNKKNEGGNSVMLKVATFIVDRRNLFFLLI